jgi:hypothetical protein
VVDVELSGRKDHSTRLASEVAFQLYASACRGKLLPQTLGPTSMLPRPINDESGLAGHSDIRPEGSIEFR